MLGACIAEVLPILILTIRERAHCAEVIPGAMRGEVATSSARSIGDREPQRRPKSLVSLNSGSD